MTWQPISTVPRDGTRVLLYFTDGFPKSRIQTGHWLPELECWLAGGLALKARRVSHWMPLPDPPGK